MSGITPRALAAALGILLGFAIPAGAQQNPDYVMSLADVTAEIGDQVELPFLLESSALGITGFATGICNDGALLNPVVFAPAPVLTQMNNGQGPDFFSVSLDPTGGSGLTCGTVFSFVGVEVIPPGPLQVVVNMGYESFAATPGVTEIMFCGTLGTPPIETFVETTKGTSETPTQISGLVTFVAGTPYQRGDSNADGVQSIADPIYALFYMFLNGPAVCLNAMDVNGDSSIDLADVLYHLFYLNGMGPAPAAPFPQCDVVPTGIGCELFSCP